MRKMIFTGLSIVSLSLFIFFACGGDPAGVTTPITVTSPTSSTVWEHYQADVTIGWSGGSTDNVSIKLVRAGEIVATLASAAPNSGTFILSERVSTSWNSGTNYIIRIEDGLGEIGNSAEFEIAASSGEDIIQVTNPSSSTEWCYYQENLTIAWSYPSTRSGSNTSVPVNGARSTGCFSGDSVDIELYQGESFVATLGSGVSSTAGSYTYAGPVPTTWSTGSDYKVKVIDDLGNYGFSSTFSISESSGADIITVTDPNSSTEWEYEQTGTTVSWEFPSMSTNRNASLGSMNHSLSGTDSDNVRMEIWHEGSKVGDYSGWVPNSGSYTRSEALLPSWSGSNYQIKVIDENDNYGISQEFLIAEPSGHNVITVTQPNSSTEWDYEEIGVSVEWTYPYSANSPNRNTHTETNLSLSGTDAESVRLEIWYDGSKLTDFSGWIDNTGSYNRTEPLLSEWSGSEYQIKVIDSSDNYGTSELFTISEPSGEEVITVTQPNSSTEWEYEQTGTTVEWSFPYPTDSYGLSLHSLFARVNPETDSDNVRLEIWHEGSKVADYSGWVPNSGSYTRNDPLPTSWGTGFNYQIKVIDENDNYGLSENFLVSGSIDVTVPSSSTVWDIGESNTQVAWVGGGAQVKLEVWYSGQYVADYSGWINNTGSYTRTAAIPSSWSIGEHFRIRVVETGSSPNGGFSDEFQIFDEVNVIEPDSETKWVWGETGVTVNWNEPYSDNVSIYVYKGGSSVGTLASSVPNTGSYTSTTPIPSSWGTGEDFQVKIVGGLGSTGFSDNFGIWAINVTQPNSSTVWEWEQANTEVEWVPGSGSIVRMEIWKDGSKVDDYCDWTDDDGSYIRSAAIPETWGEGDDYQIKMIDDLNNAGWSEEFAISPDLLPEGMEFASIPQGSFEMGAPEGEQGSSSDERPVHTVTFGYDFEMMTTEVTQGMWLEVMGSNPSYFTGLDKPVEMVSWVDCQSFVNAMNDLDPYHAYRLPSESEWEYCCRADTTERFYWGEDSGETVINGYAWWSGNSGSTTHSVAEKLPNAWGLYDMSGNVYEWCEDWYHNDYNNAPPDGSAWLVPPGGSRVFRGGGWYSLAGYCRSANRSHDGPSGHCNYLGLRLARS